MKQNILLICPSFFGYEKRIHQTYASLGYNVTYINEKPNSLKDRYFRIINKSRIDSFYLKHEEKILNKIKNDFNYLIVIRSGYLSQNFYEKLYRKVTFGKKILYEWDSVLYVNYVPLIPYFDKVYSFDKKDCESLCINYLPLFWTKEKIKGAYKKKSDIFFCGSMNADRQEILLKILRHCKEKNMVLSIYLYTPITTLIKLLVQHKKKLPLSYLHLFKLSHKAFYKKCMQSRSVLDINTANQCGLTMRTFEVISLNRFLFTTNKNIQKEKRIPSDRYSIIDLLEEKQWDFSIKEFEVEESFLSYFSIEAWCKNIITSK